jgi:hypothetical protein
MFPKSKTRITVFFIFPPVLSIVSKVFISFLNPPHPLFIKGGIRGRTFQRGDF